MRFRSIAASIHFPPIVFFLNGVADESHEPIFSFNLFTEKTPNKNENKASTKMMHTDRNNIIFTHSHRSFIKLLFSPLEDKNHIFAPLSKILYTIIR